MAIVTFISDFGLRDAYVAVVKAKILSENPEITIVDISHEVAPANLADGAFVLATSYLNFPEDTVHLVAVDSTGNQGDPFVAMKLNNHFFVGTDNGIFSLISEHQPTEIVVIPQSKPTTFPARDVFASAAAKLASGEALASLGKAHEQVKQLLGRQTKATKKEIAGHVIKVDHYGNLITSIKKKDFDVLSKDKAYTVGFGKETSNEIQITSNQVDTGDCFVLFNHLGLLEIGIRNGNASELLGLYFDSPVWIKFAQ